MSPITRRNLVVGSTAAVVAASLPRQKAVAASPPDIVDVSGTDNQKMVEAALAALGGIGRFVGPGDYVVLKANAAFANPPSWGTTTDPKTVVAVAKACIAQKAKSVVLLEFPQAKGRDCLERCGLVAALKAVPEVKLKLLTEEKEFKSVKIRGGKALKTTAVAKQLLSADVLITIPTAKNHIETGVSFGLKNNMGMIYDRDIFHTDINIHQGIADLGRVIRPDLVILDATRALLTGGPAGPGETDKPGRIIAGKNVVSTDAYALGVARFNQRRMTLAQALHIRLAAEAGLGEADIKKLKVQRIKV